jgi:hypothetical protein
MTTRRTSGPGPRDVASHLRSLAIGSLNQPAIDLAQPSGLARRQPHAFATPRNVLPLCCSNGPRTFELVRCADHGPAEPTAGWYSVPLCQQYMPGASPTANIMRSEHAVSDATAYPCRRPVRIRPFPLTGPLPSQRRLSFTPLDRRRRALGAPQRHADMNVHEGPPSRE